MRSLRLLSLLIAVGAAAAASVAATPASATVLCKAAAQPCHEKDQYPANTTIKATLREGTKTTLTSGFITVTCTGSTLSNTTSAQAGSPLPGQFDSLLFSGCTSGLGSCSAAESELPAASSLNDDRSGNGTLTVKGAGILFSCGGKICHYNAASLPMSLSGGNPSAIAVNASLEKAYGSNSLCSKTIKWAGTYDVSSPTPLYAGTVGTPLCSKNESPCPFASQYVEGQTIEGSLGSGKSFVFVGGLNVTVTCSTSTLDGQAEGSWGASANVSFGSNTLNSCTSGLGACAASIDPFSAKFSSSGGGNGTLALEHFSLAMTCAGKYCRYEIGEVSLPVIGGAPAEASGLNVTMSKQPGSDQLCTSTAKWTANYLFNQPSPLYLESTS